MAAASGEVFEKVKDVLVEALGVEADDVTPDATLTGDLGAESIDFLDVVFRLEQAFGIEIRGEELFPGPSLLENRRFVKRGKLTAEGLAEFQAKAPHADLTDFRNDPDIKKLPSLYTVKAITDFIETQLSAA